MNSYNNINFNYGSTSNNLLPQNNSNPPENSINCALNAILLLAMMEQKKKEEAVANNKNELKHSRQWSAVDTIFELPIEVLALITNYLSISDLFSLSLICKKMNSSCDTNIVWTKFLPKTNIHLSENEGSYKTIFKEKAFSFGFQNVLPFSSIKLSRYINPMAQAPIASTEDTIFFVGIERQRSVISQVNIFKKTINTTPVSCESISLLSIRQEDVFVYGKNCYEIRKKNVLDDVHKKFHLPHTRGMDNLYSGSAGVVAMDRNYVVLGTKDEKCKHTQHKLFVFGKNNKNFYQFDTESIQDCVYHKNKFYISTLNSYFVDIYSSTKNSFSYKGRLTNVACCSQLHIFEDKLYILPQDRQRSDPVTIFDLNTMKREAIRLPPTCTLTPDEWISKSFENRTNAGAYGGIDTWKAYTHSPKFDAGILSSGDCYIFDAKNCEFELGKLQLEIEVASKVKLFIHNNTLLCSDFKKIDVYDIRTQKKQGSYRPIGNETFSYISDIHHGRIIATSESYLYLFSSKPLFSEWDPL